MPPAGTATVLELIVIVDPSTAQEAPKLPLESKLTNLGLAGIEGSTKVKLELMAGGGERVSPKLEAAAFLRIALRKSILAAVLAADCQTKVLLPETYVAEAGEVRFEIDPGVPTTPPD